MIYIIIVLDEFIFHGRRSTFRPNNLKVSPCIEDLYIQILLSFFSSNKYFRSFCINLV